MRADITMTGMSPRARTRRTTSSPAMPGSMRSVITRSNGSEPESSSRPSLPEKACVQANPLWRKCTATTSLMSASSSMITMDAGSLIEGIVPQGKRGNPHFESRNRTHPLFAPSPNGKTGSETRSAMEKAENGNVPYLCALPPSKS